MYTHAHVYDGYGCHRIERFVHESDQPVSDRRRRHVHHILQRASVCVHARERACVRACAHACSHRNTGPPIHGCKTDTCSATAPSPNTNTQRPPISYTRARARSYPRMHTCTARHRKADDADDELGWREPHVRVVCIGHLATCAVPCGAVPCGAVRLRVCTAVWKCSAYGAQPRWRSGSYGPKAWSRAGY